MISRATVEEAQLRYLTYLNKYLLENGWVEDEFYTWSKGIHHTLTDEEAFYQEGGYSQEFVFNNDNREGE